MKIEHIIDENGDGSYHIDMEKGELFLFVLPLIFFPLLSMVWSLFVFPTEILEVAMNMVWFITGYILAILWNFGVYDILQEREGKKYDR